MRSSHRTPRQRRSLWPKNPRSSSVPCEAKSDHPQPSLKGQSSGSRVNSSSFLAAQTGLGKTVRILAPLEGPPARVKEGPEETPGSICPVAVRVTNRRLSQLLQTGRDVLPSTPTESFPSFRDPLCMGKRLRLGRPARGSLSSHVSSSGCVCSVLHWFVPASPGMLDLVDFLVAKPAAHRPSVRSGSQTGQSPS